MTLKTTTDEDADHDDGTNNEDNVVVVAKVIVLGDVSGSVFSRSITSLLSRREDAKRAFFYVAAIGG